MKRQDLDRFDVEIFDAGAEAMRRACLAVIETQLADLTANNPGVWAREFAANTCRAVASAIEALPVLAAGDAQDGA